MTTISIIGSGNMATAVGTRAAKHGHTIELMSRNTAKAQALADQIGNGATAGERPQPAALQGLRLGQATCSRIPVRDRHPTATPGTHRPDSFGPSRDRPF